ncbi:MAG TPA: XdhC family protein [Nitrososphaerales archaeon]|nr:XdhC family protein [Nitrososphaerales archaeon]
MKQSEFAQVLASLSEKRDPFAVATVVKVEGSSVGKPGFKVVVSQDGRIVYGSLGGVCPDSAIIGVAQKTMATGIPKTVKVFLEDVEDAVEGVVKSQSDDEIHVEINCGGSMEIYIEPYLAQQRLLVIGQGGRDEVEDALVKLGMMMDFEVTVIDHNPVLSEQPDQLIKDLDFDLTKFEIYDTDSVVVLTKGAKDVETLAAISRSSPRYVGMMASRQRASEDLHELKRQGVDQKFIDSIRTPVGVDLGALTPSEIALSIIAEVVALKHGKQLPSKSLERKPEAASLRR